MPRGRVLGVDASKSMVEHARRALGDRATVFAADLAELSLDEPVSTVFSNAVFHWIPDHERLFARLFDVLRPGGRLIAQCGGRGNVATLGVAVSAVFQRPELAAEERPPGETWNFAGPKETSARLEHAGFVEVQAWLEPKRVAVEREFLRTVTLGPHLDRLPPERHDLFVDAVAEELGEPLELDYVRLNIDARRPHR